MEVGKKEIITQNRIINLFQQQLNYQYLGNWKERKNNRNIEEQLLRQYLSKNNYSNTLINKALKQINDLVTNQNRSIYELNKEFYGLLRYGVKIKEEIGANTETIW